MARELRKEEESKKITKGSPRAGLYSLQNRKNQVK